MRLNVSTKAIAQFYRNGSAKRSFRSGSSALEREWCEIINQAPEAQRAFLVEADPERREHKLLRLRAADEIFGDLEQSS